MVGLVVVVLGFGFVNYSNSALSPGKYVIENFSGNFYDNGDNSVTVEGEEQLGAAEFNTGKTVFNELAESVLVRRTIYVTAAQVDGLKDDENGIELIPAVGSGKVIQVESIVGFNRYASEAYSRNNEESFEVKWDSGTLASGGNNRVNIGASFSSGFLTRGTATSTASKSVEVWRPYVNTDVVENNYLRSRVASSSAVVLSGNVNPSNSQEDGITDFVFEVIYRILPTY